MKYPVILFTTVSLLAVIGCHKTAPITPFSASDFPLTVGNSWVYHVLHTVNHSVYNNTETITISGKQILSADSILYTVQHSKSNSSVTDIQYLLTVDDAIVYNPVSVSSTPLGYMSLKLPFGQANHWINNGTSDTFSVKTFMSSVGLVGSPMPYNNVYEIQISSPPSSSITHSGSIWLSQGLGIVQYNLDTYDSINILGQISSTLISYHLQ